MSIADLTKRARSPEYSYEIAQNDLGVIELSKFCVGACEGDTIDEEALIAFAKDGASRAP